MKPNHTRALVLPAILLGLHLSAASAQDGPPRGERPAGPPEAASRVQPERIRAAVREMQELRAAGKHEEARNLAMRLREQARENPALARRIEGQMAEPRKDAPKSKAAAPDRPMLRQAAAQRHLRQAAMHLEAAGMPEVAKRVRAEGLRRMKQAAPTSETPRRPAAGPATKGAPPMPPGLIEEIRTLRQQNKAMAERLERLEQRDRAQAPRQPNRPAPETRPERPERPERPAQAERPERPSAPERPERPARPERPERPEI
jgi:hypothetical protein